MVAVLVLGLDLWLQVIPLNAELLPRSSRRYCYLSSRMELGPKPWKFRLESENDSPPQSLGPTRGVLVLRHDTTQPNPALAARTGPSKTRLQSRFSLTPRVQTLDSILFALGFNLIPSLGSG